MNGKRAALWDHKFTLGLAALAAALVVMPAVTLPNPLILVAVVVVGVLFIGSFIEILTSKTEPFRTIGRALWAVGMVVAIFGGYHRWL